MAKETPKSKKPAAKKPAAKTAKSKAATKTKATSKTAAKSKSTAAKSKGAAKTSAKTGAKTASKAAKKPVAKKKVSSTPKKKTEITEKTAGTKRPVTLKDVPVIEQKSTVSGSTSIRMFKNPVLEKLSHVHPIVPFILYVPVVLLSIYNYLSSEDTDFVTFITLFPLGIFFWSFTEYTLHRFLFHPPLAETRLRWLYFYTHGVHHEAPNDSTRLVMPPGASIPLAIIFYFIFQAIMPVHYLAFYAGFVTGYMIYDFLHFATHFYSFTGEWFKKLKKHHSVHHFNNPKKNFGVSSSLWDYVFATKYRSGN